MAVIVLVDRIDVVRVPDSLRWHRNLRLAQRHVVEHVPLEDELPGLEVDLLDRRVLERALLRAAVGGQVDRHLLGHGEDRRPTRGEEDLVAIGGEAVAGEDRCDPPVVLVIHVKPRARLRGTRRQVRVLGRDRDRPLPPRQNRFAEVALGAEVDDLLAAGRLLKPDGIAASVEDQRSWLPDQRVRRGAMERIDEDQSRRRARARDVDGHVRRVQSGRRHEAPRARLWQGSGGAGAGQRDHAECHRHCGIPTTESHCVASSDSGPRANPGLTFIPATAFDCLS